MEHLQNDTVTISVILATFNEPPDMIKKSIKSILEQTFTDFELLIYDDSTNAETISAIDSFKYDERVKIFRSTVKKGFVVSLNEGLSAAKGKYIARMDGDDISLPDRLEKEYVYLENNKKVFVVGGNMDIIDENDNVISSRKYPTDGLRLYFFSCFRCPLAHPSIMMRRELIDYGFRYNEKLKRSEDLDLWLRIINSGYKIANLPDTIINYRILNNFEDKRSNDVQRKYTFKVRKENFSFKNMIFSVFSFIGGALFAFLPVNIIKSAYKIENKRVHNDPVL